jgi:prolyl-tRNA synthetase
MAPCPAGENDVALAPGYAANVEVASATPQPVELPPEQDVEQVSTPGATTVAQVCEALGVPAGALIKAYPIIVGEAAELRLVLVRGDHRVNDIKLGNTLGEGFRPAHESEFADAIGPAGYIGPVGTEVPILLDSALDGASYISGANVADAHLRGVKPGRDFQFTEVDVRTVEVGDTVDGHAIRIEPAIEIGNIFKLGTRYSVPLGATYLDEDGTAKPIWMGSYGIGPARIAAAAVEQFADEKGISWPRALAPFDVHLVGLGKPGTDEFALAERLYDELRAVGLDVFYDDRNLGPGAKFADAELVGVPLRLTVGRRTLEAGEIEAQVRRGREQRSLPLEGAAQAARDLWASLP